MFFPPVWCTHCSHSDRSFCIFTNIRMFTLYIFTIFTVPLLIPLTRTVHTYLAYFYLWPAKIHKIHLFCHESDPEWTENKWTTSRVQKKINKKYSFTTAKSTVSRVKIMATEILILIPCWEPFLTAASKDYPADFLSPGLTFENLEMRRPMWGVNLSEFPSHQPEHFLLPQKQRQYGSIFCIVYTAQEKHCQGLW